MAGYSARETHFEQLPNQGRLESGLAGPEPLAQVLQPSYLTTYEVGFEFPGQLRLGRHWERKKAKNRSNSNPKTEIGAIKKLETNARGSCQACLAFRAGSAFRAPYVICAKGSGITSRIAHGTRRNSPVRQWVADLNRPLGEADPEVFDIIEHEKRRQRSTLALIASEVRAEGGGLEMGASHAVADAELCAGGRL